MQQSTTHKVLAWASGRPVTRNSNAFSRQLQTALLIVGALLTSSACSGVGAAQVAGAFQTTNILSDGFVPATTTDANFVDPWGISGGNTLWIDTNVTGFSYVSSIAGVLGSFKAVVPAASGTGAGSPTGTVQNTTTGFVLSNGSKASFLFATLDGTISGWNSATSAGGNHALIAINNSANNAVYPDLALVTNTAGTFLLAPNFGQGAKVEIYNSTFQPATLAGTFTDPNVPTGYAPYAIKVLGTQVFVTYMLRTVPPFAAGAGTYQEILGTNTGFVSVFDVNGNFVARVVTGGNLNAPWGVAIAPAGFGIYGGDLLIGNFGDGLITAYSPAAPYAYLGMVADATGRPIAFPGLWEIFVSTATGANTSAIYFDAGLAKETHGLFGAISNSTTSNASPTFNLSTSSQVATVAAGGSTALTISVAPTSAFSGTVSFHCSGLPLGASCSFATPQITVSATAPATEVLTLQTSSAMSRGYVAIAGTLLLPFGSFLAFRRRREFWRLFGGLVLLVASAGLFVGCGGSGTPGTPLGTSNVTITATSGSITQTSVVALTVQ